jgi:hypothetical protein
MRFALALVVVAIVAPSAAHRPTDRQHVITPEGLAWTPYADGLERAVLLGDPDKGEFIVRIRATTDTDVAPHTHPASEFVTVLSGKIAIGFGVKWVDAALQTAPVHSSYLTLAKAPHYARFYKGTEVEVHGGLSEAVR